MNIATILRLTFGLLIISVMGFFLVSLPRQAQAQNAGSPAAVEKFGQEELAQMLGPIALYPDKLLSQILMASTYPIEVIEADRWVKKNPKLAGDPLDRALLDKEWDPSVKAICHFPAILALMSERITETTNLGNAFLAQETEVMDMIQQLRSKARAQGNLVTTKEQKVSVENGMTIIEPADPKVVYVPYYDPFYIYGPWWYPAYFPYYWGPPGVSLGIGISFWPGIYFGFSWGSWGYFDWHHHHIYIYHHERPRYVRHDHWYTKPGPWRHSPVHRRGVAYRDKVTATQYGQYPQRTNDYRYDTRGFPERSELDQELGRLGNERATVGQGRPVDDNMRLRRSQQEQQRVERELQKREPLLRQPAAGSQQKSPKIAHDRQVLEQAGQERQEPAKEGRVVKGQGSPEQEQQLQRQTGQEIRVQDSVEREQPQLRRETVFDLYENDQSVRQSSERGRSSRQERNVPFRDRDQRGGEKEPGRYGGGRGQR